MAAQLPGRPYRKQGCQDQARLGDQQIGIAARSQPVTEPHRPGQQLGEHPVADAQPVFPGYDAVAEDQAMRLLQILVYFVGMVSCWPSEESQPQDDTKADDRRNSPGPRRALSPIYLIQTRIITKSVHSQRPPTEKHCKKQLLARNDIAGISPAMSCISFCKRVVRSNAIPTKGTIGSRKWRKRSCSGRGEVSRRRWHAGRSRTRPRRRTSACSTALQAPRATQRKPMCVVALSIICAWRAAGR